MGIKVFLIKFFYLIILMIVITFGTFDLFHIGHINILERAKKKGDKLIVGVSTDKLNFSKKQKYPIYSQNERKKIIDSLKFVDEVFFEESLEKKREYILKYKADILVMGNDWEVIGEIGSSWNPRC